MWSVSHTLTTCGVLRKGVERRLSAAFASPGHAPRLTKTMWIQTDRPIRRMNRPWLSKPVEFNDNGKAQIPDDDAEALIDRYDFVYPTGDETDDDESDGDDGDE